MIFLIDPRVPKALTDGPWWPTLSRRERLWFRVRYAAKASRLVYWLRKRSGRLA